MPSEKREVFVVFDQDTGQHYSDDEESAWHEAKSWAGNEHIPQTVGEFKTWALANGYTCERYLPASDLERVQARLVAAENALAALTDNLSAMVRALKEAKQ